MPPPHAQVTRPYRNLGLFFLLLLVLVLAGFTPAVPGTPFFGYFGQAPRFEHVPAVIHWHAACAMAWFVLLALQPFLVRAGRLDLHRLLGRISPLVAAAFLFTALQVMKHFHAQAILRLPRDTVLTLLAQSFTGITLFTVFYVLAILRRRRLHHHVAFMVAAALASATPGLARLGLYLVGGLPGILTVMALIYATLAGFALYAKYRWHQPLLKSPYLAIAAMFLLGHAMDFVGSRSRAWLWLADRIVSIW